MRYFMEVPNCPDYYTCTICDEKKVKHTPKQPLSGKKKWNLKKHLKTVHTEFYYKFIDPEKQLEYVMKRLVKLQCFCEIVTINGRPFQYLLDSGFQRSIESDMKLLKETGHGITIDKNFTEIKEYINKIAEKLSKEFSRLFDGRYISLMLDVGSKNNNSVLGISAQYIDKCKPIIHTIGMTVLNESHKSQNLSKKTNDCLKSFDIQCDHVISMTTDNAYNMIAMIRNFDDLVQEEHENDSNVDMIGLGISSLDVNVPLTENQMNAVIQNLVDMDELNQVINDEDDFTDLFEEVIGDISKSTNLVFTIRCGAHTIQLMVLDGIKKSNFRSIVILAKYIAKKLRTDKFKFEARDAGFDYKVPHVSCTTRWNSDYIMVSRN